MNTKEIKLPIGGIVVTVDYDSEDRPVSGNISTQLKVDVEDEGDEFYNAAMDAIESLVLAHAMAEIDIQSNGYIEGLEIAITSCDNNF